MTIHSVIFGVPESSINENQILPTEKNNVMYALGQQYLVYKFSSSPIKSLNIVELNVALTYQ